MFREKTCSSSEGSNCINTASGMVIPRVLLRCRVNKTSKIVKYFETSVGVFSLNGLMYQKERNLTFRHRASCILGQAFHYSPENAFYVFNQQIYSII